MWKTMALVAGLACCAPLAVRADGPGDSIHKTVRVEMKGHFLFRADHADILRPDSRLIVDGKTYVVNLGTNRDLWHAAAALDGHTAVVTGTLDGDRIDATSVKADPDFIHKTVTVQVKGRLYWNNVRLRELVPEFALISSSRHFTLSFASKELRELAKQFNGQDVLVTGTLFTTRAQWEPAILQRTEDPLMGDTIAVTALEVVKGHYVKQTVEVTVRARLHHVVKDARTGEVLFSCDRMPRPFNKSWALAYGVTIDGRLYVLDLDGDRSLLGQAAMFAGSEIVLTGTLHGDRIAVTSLLQAQSLIPLNPAVPVIKRPLDE